MSVNNLVIDPTLMQIRMLAEVFLCSVLSKDNFADYSQFVSRQREKGRHTLQKIVAGNCSRAHKAFKSCLDIIYFATITYFSMQGLQRLQFSMR